MELMETCVENGIENGSDVQPENTDSADQFKKKMMKSIHTEFPYKTKDKTKLSSVFQQFIRIGSELLKKKTKDEKNWKKISKFMENFNNFMVFYRKSTKAFGDSFNNTQFKSFCKFCLKFGVSESSVLLKLLCEFLKCENFNANEAELLHEMIFTHSEFFNVVLTSTHECKDDLIELIGIILKKWPKLLSKAHMPIILSSYNATLRKSDLVLYDLLKLCAEKQEQTNFYTFKPFLWSHAAAKQYSVRLQIEKALIRQPKMSDVMDILHEDKALNTLRMYPLNISFHNDKFLKNMNEEQMKKVYDLRFLYQVFNLLLSPENVVLTHKFTMSGALTLTISGLSCENEEVRAASMGIINRFYSHVEAKIKGKDNLLWLTFLSTIQRGVAQLPDNKLNNFAVVFFGRMAQVLTKPQHVMYKQLSEYLVAKDDLNLNCIPELYTLLHSSKVENKEHRKFILQVIRDGMRTEKDVEISNQMKAFKFLMELYTSVISDFDTKLIIISIFKNTAKIPVGAKKLLIDLGIVSYLFTISQFLTPEDSTIKKEILDLIDCLLNNSNIDDYTSNLTFIKGQLT